MYIYIYTYTYNYIYKAYIVDGCVAAVGDHADDVLQLVLLVPHLAAVAHNAPNTIQRAKTAVRNVPHDKNTVRK